MVSKDKMFIKKIIHSHSMLEVILEQISKDQLVKRKWHVGRGRNSNVGYWNGE